MNLLDLVFPIKCLECGTSSKYICADCISKVKTPPVLCYKCLRPSFDGATHAKCGGPLSLDGVSSLWRYEGVVRKAIIALKYKYATKVANEILVNAENALAKIKLCFPRNSVLVPIPSHWYRKNYRGFNQTELFGEKAAFLLGLKYEPNLLTRRAGTSQVSLKGKDRSKNIRRAFFISPNIPVSQYLTTKGRIRILLFDDVWTTGSTMKEACKVLKRKGADKVWGLTIAR